MAEKKKSCLLETFYITEAYVDTEMFQDHLVLMLYWNTKIFYEIKIMKTGLGSMCFLSIFQILPDDNHEVLWGACICFQCSCNRMKGSFSFLTCCVSNNSFHPLANVNCHPWFTFIHQNGKCMWSAKPGSRLLSENVIHHRWLAFWVQLSKIVEKQTLAGNKGKEVKAKRLAF